MDNAGLHQKGWSKPEIEHAGTILEKPRSHDHHFSQIVLWSALVVIIFANIIVSMVLLPFLPLLSFFTAVLLVIVLGGAVGFLYNLLINDIGHLEKKHHVLAGLLIPVLALANMLGMVFIANNLDAGKLVVFEHNPYVLAIIYAVALILPYLGRKVNEKLL